jgi:S-adenosylmethionine:tRNA ribosyltransferase-isomerase
MHTKPSDYDYHLPDELIAAHPVEPREVARLLTWPLRDGDLSFADLPDLLQAGDVLVVNNSRVIPARLKCSRPSATGEHEDLQTEILLHRPLGDFQTWTIFAQKTKRLKIGQHLHFAFGMIAEILERRENGLVIRFHASAAETERFIDMHGEMPLPPYIPRDKEHTDSHDKEDYQTIYAKDKGSVAAPTAGLHFSHTLMARLKERGVIVTEVTLHVGAGTFQPMYAHLESIHEHKMHSEFGIVTQDTVDTINAAKARGNHVIPVGTTSLRLVESAARDGTLKPFVGDTDIFITPGFQFHVADRLITNFHLPQSTLLILVSAFIGFENMHALYKRAITDRYRFYSYGDGCLLDCSNRAR